MATDKDILDRQAATKVEFHLVDNGIVTHQYLGEHGRVSQFLPEKHGVCCRGPSSVSSVIF